MASFARAFLFVCLLFHFFQDNLDYLWGFFMYDCSMLAINPLFLETSVNHLMYI